MNTLSLFRNSARSMVMLLGLTVNALAQTNVNPALLQQTRKLPVEGLTPRVPITIDTTIVSQITWDVRPNATSTDPGLFLFPNQTGGIQVALSGASSTSTSPYTVKLRYSNPAILTGPSTVSIPANSRLGSFNVVAKNVTQLTSCSIRAWVFDSTKAKTVVVSVKPANQVCNAPIPTLSAPTTTRRNGTVTITARLSCTPTVATTLQITSSNPAMIPNPPGNVVVVPAGSNTVSYTTTTGNAQATTIVTLSAFILGTNPLMRADDIQVAITTQ